MSLKKIRIIRLVCLALAFVFFGVRLLFEIPRMGHVAWWVIPVTILGAIALVFGLAALILWRKRTRARQAKALLQSQRPTATIVETFWGNLSMQPFLLPGPLTKKVRGRAVKIMVIADDNGIELTNTARIPDSFGLIPWNLVRTMQMVPNPVRSAAAPLLLIEVFAHFTAYREQIVLAPSPKSEQIVATELCAWFTSRQVQSGHFPSV